MEAQRADVEVRGAIIAATAAVGAFAAAWLVAGPELLADDWVWVRNGEFLGWWDAGSTRQVGRPGAFVLYALTFGLTGAHPFVHAVIQLALWVVAAAVLYRALAVFFDRRTASIVWVVWLVAPSHTTLELWASTSQAWVAVILVADGTRRLAVAKSRRGRGVAYAFLAASGAFYEVALPVAALAVPLVDRWRGKARRWRPWIVGAAVAAPAGIWSVVSSTVYPETAGLEQEWRVIPHLAGSIALGAPPDEPVSRVLVAVAIAGAAGVIVSVARHRTASLDEQLVLVGMAMVLASTAVAVRAYLDPVGIGNRLTAASGVGAAMMWVGLARLASPWVPARVGKASAVAAVGLALALRVDHLVDWMSVADATGREAPRIAARAAEDRDGVVILHDSPAVGRLTYGLLDGWNTTAATQVLTNDPSLVVLVQDGCLLTGPPPDAPLTQYGQAPDRVDESCRRAR